MISLFRNRNYQAVKNHFADGGTRSAREDENERIPAYAGQEALG